MGDWPEYAGHLRDRTAHSPEHVEALKEVSIRGRVALGTTCLEALCGAYKIEDARIQAIIAHLWTYASSLRLDIWEDEMWGLVQWVVEAVETQGNLADTATLDGRPMTLIRAIYEVNEIACSDLYGGTLAWSPNTLRWTFDVLERLREAEVPWPALAPFLRSSFGDAGGWGHPVDPSFFRPDC